MKARELMEDAPELDVLVDRCLSRDYEIDQFDFFYMQALSERDKLRFPDFNPSDGHWYGASVSVAGGLCQGEMRNFNYGSEILSANEDLIRLQLRHEIETVKGNPQRRHTYQESKPFYTTLKSARPPVLDKLNPVILNWSQLVEDFLASCRAGISDTTDVYNNVDFSSPLFRDSILFLPFKERRIFTPDETVRLDSTSAHDLYPFMAHLMYQFMLRENSS